MSWRFSTRTDWDLHESTFAAAVRSARSSNPHLLDLTNANPTSCNFLYPPGLLEPLTNPAALLYHPDPRGLLSAREAVAIYYAAHHAPLNPDHLLLTTSTSEAYSFTFRLLCNPGDEILIATPGYPLFDFIAGLDDVRLRTYPLFYDHGWWIDFAELERSITPRTRAIVVVHPNNPTGHATSAREREQLQQLCLTHHLALIVDEVFLDYAFNAPIDTFARGPHPVPTFLLSGMSKIAGLPQVKVAWLAVLGPDPVTREALDRLAVIADTFLSMNAPAQLALPAWLRGRGTLHSQITARTRANLAALHKTGLTTLHAEAGWSIVLRLPQKSAQPALDLLSRGVLVHPGDFYGISEQGRIVLSLIVPTATFQAGLETIHAWSTA